MDILELKAAMARKAVSASDLAAIIGVSKKTVYERLNGKQSFTQIEIQKIANALHLSKDQIVSIFFSETVS